MIGRIWNHKYTERALRLGSLVLIVVIPLHFWFVAGLSDSPAIFLLLVGGVVVMALTVAIPLGWLSKANMKRSWGWLFGVRAD